MVKIGIVDDEEAPRAQLRQELARFEAEYGTEFEVSEFDSAASFLSAEHAGCNILYLDIDMPQMTGMELAEKIRETDNEVIIIFCTNLQQFALNGYKVSALGFLVKPVQWYSFHMFLSRALHTVEQRARLSEDPAAQRVVIKDGSVSKVLYAADIRYVEVQQHYLMYHVWDKKTDQGTVIQTRGSMHDAADQLSQYGFARCSASFLVNLSSITAVNRMDIHIGQEVLRIGRTYRESFTREFSKFLAKSGWENP